MGNGVHFRLNPKTKKVPEKFEMKKKTIWNDSQIPNPQHEGEKNNPKRRKWSLHLWPITAHTHSSNLKQSAILKIWKNQNNNKQPQPNQQRSQVWYSQVHEFIESIFQEENCASWATLPVFKQPEIDHLRSLRMLGFHLRYVEINSHQSPITNVGIPSSICWN